MSDFAAACLFAVVVWFGFLVAGMAVGYAAKPPEKVEAIDCSIFAALPLLKEAQPFLRDPAIPTEADFRTRLAYTQDWNDRRSDIARRFDELVRVCDEHVKTLGSGN